MSRRLVAIAGVFAVEKDGEVIAVLAPGTGDGWGCVFTTGNLAGSADSFTDFQDAFERSRRFTPWSDEGSREGR